MARKMGYFEELCRVYSDNKLVEFWTLDYCNGVWTITREYEEAWDDCFGGTIQGWDYTTYEFDTCLQAINWFNRKHGNK